MKQLTLTLGLFILIGCGPSAEEKAYMDAHGGKPIEVTKHLVFDHGNVNETYKIVTIDDCQYIQGWAGGSEGGPYLTHKGDCNNPIHVLTN